VTRHSHVRDLTRAASKAGTASLTVTWSTVFSTSRETLTSLTSIQIQELMLEGTRMVPKKWNIS